MVAGPHRKDAAHRATTDGPSSGEAAIGELLPFLLRALGARTGPTGPGASVPPHR
ncbi:hypothetical protein AB0G35_28530 [Streptomyces sp. NPDC021749]|uniref:hypothetical protein n=1 Tax=Streptomyces sp. NPDC021749 TaxID=3154905 RepID=UPI0033C64C8E